MMRSELSSTEFSVVPLDYDALARRIRTAIEPARAASVSFHDGAGDLLWLSESSMGPDEHDAVRAAAEMLSEPSVKPLVVMELTETQRAICIRSSDREGSTVGITMLLIDTRYLGKGGDWHQLITPALQTALDDFLEHRQSEATPADSAPAPLAPAPLEFAPSEAPVLELQPLAPAPLAPAPSAPVTLELTPVDLQIEPHPVARAEPSPPRPTPPEADTVAAPPEPATSTRLQAAPPVRAAGSGAERRKLEVALSNCPIALNAQPLIPLSGDEECSWYEVLLRSKSATAPNTAPLMMLKTAVEQGLGAIIDRRVSSELILFLAQHPSLWKDRGTRFSINLTANALYDAGFVPRLADVLNDAQVPAAVLAFEVDAAQAREHWTALEQTAVQLDTLGCSLLLDDFDLNSDAPTLLRLPNLRMLKFRAGLMATMRTEPLTRAFVGGLAQTARLLTLQTTAKYMQDGDDRNLLSGCGIDFVQSNSLAAATALSALIAD